MTDQASQFAAELRRLRAERGLSYRALAERAHHGKSYLEDLEKGRKPPNQAVADRLDQALGAGGQLAAILRPAGDSADHEIEAIELARRVTASDVSDETLDRLESAADRRQLLAGLGAVAARPGHRSGGRIGDRAGDRAGGKSLGTAR